MDCPTCDRSTMHVFGCKVTNDNFYWCPRCGTIKPCSEERAVAPVFIKELTEDEPLRLRLAAQMACGLLANGQMDYFDQPEAVALRAFLVADALIERAKKQPDQ